MVPLRVQTLNPLLEFMQPLVSALLITQVRTVKVCCLVLQTEDSDRV